MGKKQEKIKEINKQIIEIGDIQDEFEYYDEERTKKVLGELLIGYKATLKGVVNIIKNSR